MDVPGDGDAALVLYGGGAAGIAFPFIDDAGWRRICSEGCAWRSLREPEQHEENDRQKAEVLGHGEKKLRQSVRRVNRRGGYSARAKILRGRHIAMEVS